MAIYALANQKGGVGKTTTAVSLAALQEPASGPCSSTSTRRRTHVGLGERANGTPATTCSTARRRSTSRRARIREPRADPRPAPTWPERPPSWRSAATASRFLAESLASVADPLSRFVFLDCPPSLSPLTVNALAAAGRVLVPVQAEYYALEGVAQILGSIEAVR